MNKSKIKICGIKKIDTLNHCIACKVDFFGLIYYKKSPRNIFLKDAYKLTKHIKNEAIKSVGVFVNEPINNLKNILNDIKLDYIQLHGSENNDYIDNIKSDFSIKIIKNIAIESPNDFNKIKKYKNTDFFLFDYKPAKNELPGGNSKVFSWNLLKDISISKPWFISGGINIKNINTIKKFSFPYGIDISSGVEEGIGIKSNTKIKALMDSYE